MKYRNEIASYLIDSLSQLGTEFTLEEVTRMLEVPKDPKLGNWAFPCFPLAKQLKKAPPLIAQELSERLASQIEHSENIASVTPTGPYLNFSLNKSALASDLLPLILSGEYLAKRASQEDKVMIEYSQPNTHKAFHVGHTRNATLGDTLARIFDWQGHEVVPVNYLGDEGTHVARCLWYFLNHFQGSVPETNRGEFLGELYVQSTELLDLGEYTEAPFPGVTAAKVLSSSPHPEEPSWNVVEVETVQGVKTVITAAAISGVGTLVPWAQPGVRIAGRSVGTVERKGIQSEGMLCSLSELTLGDDNDHVAELPEATLIGTEVAEIFVKKDTLPEGATSPLELIAQRETEVGKVLLQLETQAPEIQKLFAETKEWSMNELYAAYKWLDCRFDRYFFESQFGESGKELVREYQAKGIFVEDDGAIGADLSDIGLGFCLLIKRNGTALYATRDLALAKIKFQDFGIDRSLYVVDAAQTLHFQQVFACLERMGFEQAKKCYHLSYAQVVRPDGKMSSRKGNVILFSQLTKRLLDKITTEFLDKYRGEWSDDEIKETAYRLSLATIRYGMMNQDNNSQIVFDLDEWTSRTGNTGPYLMYAYARTRSILRERGFHDPKEHTQLFDWSLLDHETETNLLLQLNTYHDTLKRAYETYSPSMICTYIYDLSKKTNKMYQECSVLRAESKELSYTRAALIDAVGRVLQHGLSLLGIKTVERM
ncbi:MAG: arginine--tRNA ligase [Bdellovibrionales bacterium]|nr:arginine--tRNA ligase [Bdellovibrionales bacterium]